MTAQSVVVAPGNLNVLVLPPLSFVFLWPTFRPPPVGSPAARVGTTGAVQNHWHYRPAELQVNTDPVGWTPPPENFAAARYDYDRYYPGVVLSNIDVDLFRANPNLDFNDYATMRAVYTDAQPANPSAALLPKTLPLMCTPGTPGESLIYTARPDPIGRVSFGVVPPGDYVLYLRGRYSFVENASPGGPASTGNDRHNGVDIDALARRQPRPAHALKITVDAQRNVTASLLTTDDQGAKSTTPMAIARYLGPEESPQAASTSKPYALYVLPLVSAHNREQWRATMEAVVSSFSVDENQASDALSRTPVLDLAAIERWECSELWNVGQERATDDLLKSTLLVGGGGPSLTVAYDHAVCSFASPSATAKTRASWLPLAEQGFYSGNNSLYSLAAKTKDTYGRFSLRALAPALEGRDVREIKTRLVLWGSDTRFVDLRNDRFDQALSEALVRFKCNKNLFRVRVDDANGDPDRDKSIITGIVDAETYRILDATVPSRALADVADLKDPTNLGTPLLTEQGYCRLLLYAAENALVRIAPGRSINVHSSFRTLAHNRRVYMGPGHQLRWRVATNAGPTQVQPPNNPAVTIQGVTDRNGGSHTANQLATAATGRLDEPRGTYVGEAGAQWAADYSRHTTGKAFDFDFDRGGSVPQIQRDTKAMKLLGAHRGGHVQGRLWLEPAQTAGAAGTTDWIHMDNGDLPPDRDEFALTDDEVRGPRWDATLIVRGTVKQGRAGRVGAKVELLSGRNAVATAYADRDGKYSLRAGGIAVATGFSVRASFNRNYPFQNPAANPEEAVSDPVSVAFSFPGYESNSVDFQLPGGVEGVRYARVGTGRSILVTCAGWHANGIDADACMAWAQALQKTALGDVGHVFAVRGPQHASHQTSYPEIALGLLAFELQQLCARFTDVSDRVYVIAHSSGSFVAHALFGSVFPHAAVANRVVYCNVDGAATGLDDGHIGMMRSAFAVSAQRLKPAAVNSLNYASMQALGARFAKLGRGIFVPSTVASDLQAQGTADQVKWWLHYALINYVDATLADPGVYEGCNADNVTSDYVIFDAGVPLPSVEPAGVGVPA